eukprot:Skav216567  [mRNA]  locus=scaffold1231:77950:80262:- [translate_table: standard]
MEDELLDKARIGNLIKVLAKERRDKEDLQEKLGQQTSRLQDLEREREASQQKEAELVARSGLSHGGQPFETCVTRSVDLLRTYQLEACRKQGRDAPVNVDIFCVNLFPSLSEDGNGPPLELLV